MNAAPVLVPKPNIQVADFRKTAATENAPDLTGPQPAKPPVMFPEPALQPVKIQSPGTAEPPQVVYPTHAACRAQLMELSTGTEIGPDGEMHRRNPRQVSMDMFNATLLHLKARGKFFRIPSGPHYLDEAANELIRVPSPEFKRLMLCLDYLAKDGYTTSVSESILDCAALAQPRPYHRVAYMGEDALYIRSGENQMIRVKADAIDEVSIGCDDVILIAPDLAAWPPLKELEPLMDEMRGQVGKACTQLLPELPLSRLLTTRWATDTILSPEQAHQAFITRFLFTYAASRYSLWPITLFVGDQNSGKSTPMELMLVVFRDDPQAETKSLPPREDGLIAALTNSAICCFDNLDGARLDDPQRSTICDSICLLSTGAEVPWRKLRSDMEILNFKIKNHGFFSARTDPFAHRSDVHRRTMMFTMERPDPATTVTKDELRGAIHLARPRILAETLLRCQNLVRAHQQYGDKKYRCVSEMADYEVFTYRCAEYEGTLPATQELWEVSAKQYLEAITEHNFLILAVRIWLGRKGNVGREVSPLTLFGELREIFADTKNFPYRNPGQFGMHIKKNLSALGMLGFDKPATKSNHNYVFKPSPEEQKLCRQQYLDFMATSPAMQRLTHGGSRDAGDRDPMFDANMVDITADDPINRYHN
jgi:hypothetical protein